jgi:hypothetical protein
MQPTWPTVVRACNWFDDGYAGHSTPAMATSEITDTTTATAIATAMWPTVASAFRI